MPDYNPQDTVSLAELERLIGVDRVRSLHERIQTARWSAKCEQLLHRMREIVDALLALEPTTMESRPSWFALQEEFTSVSARLNALHAPEPLEPECELEPHCELEQVCRWCCKPYDAHLSERAPGAPQPRMPCLGLKSSYLARDCAQHAPPRSVEPEERCIACALTDGGVCPDHAAERSS